MTVSLIIMTVVLLGTTLFISTLLMSPKPPTQIQKTKAAAITYTRKVDLFPTDAISPTTTISLTSIPVSPTVVPTNSKAPTTPPTKTPQLLAQAPTAVPTVAPTIVLTKTPLPTITMAPTNVPTPTTQPLLAYKSTTISPTLIPVTDTGGMIDPTKTPSLTKKAQPTGVQQLPDTGWVQISSILFIVAASTILFSLLF